MDTTTKRLLQIIRDDEAALSIQDAAVDAEEAFIADIKRSSVGVSSDDLVTSDRSRELERMLWIARVMPSFDSLDFRNWLLALWRCTVSDVDDSFTEEEICAYESLGETEKSKAETLGSDFLHLQFDLDQSKIINDAVRHHLELNQCGKALKVLRINAPYIPNSFLHTQRTLVWQNVAAIDPRFQNIADTFKWGKEGATRVVFRETSSVNRPAGQDDRNDFLNDLKKIEPEQLNLVGESRRTNLADKIAYAETMKHFDSEAFRSYILLSWRHLSDDLSMRELDKLLIIKDQLCDEEISIADEVIGDFRPMFTDFNIDEFVTKAVTSALDVNDCDKAFDCVHEWASDLDPTVTAPLLANIWKQVTRFDSRFRVIAEGFSEFRPLVS